MPVNYPQPPGDENNVRARIIRKYMEYIHAYNREGNTNRTQGERYEIATALFLYQRGKLTQGDQLSRWDRAGGAQNISVGANTEYDFIIPGMAQFPNLQGAMPAVQGVLLGEAKSYQGGPLNPYIRKAAGYCLHDPQHLAGFCFVTPGAQIAVWRQAVAQVYGILSDPQQTPGICGGPGWQHRISVAGKPDGAAVRAHFQQYHGAVLQQQQVQVPQITQELIQNAGFFMVVYHLARMTHDQIRDAVGNLP